MVAAPNQHMQPDRAMTSLFHAEHSCHAAADVQCSADIKRNPNESLCTVKRKWHRHIIAGTIAGAGVAILWWSSRDTSPALQLPNGVSLATVLEMGLLESPKGWYTNPVATRPPLVTLDNISFRKIRWATGFKFGEMLGRIGLDLPPKPTTLELKSQLDECSRASGKTYLLAQELMPTNFISNWDPILRLGFMYDGTNTCDNARRRIAIIETAILKNGVLQSRMREYPVPAPSGGFILSEFYSTNLCAIIRDRADFVKIVPLNCLATYSRSGLINLPSRLLPGPRQ